MTITFTPSHPIWCAGCGHFGVKNAIVNALATINQPAHETMVLAGIGCSGTIQNNIDSYGYHALHGRVLPTALGVKLANPELMVIAAGGDGDGYAIGAGHLMHTFKRNPSIVYVLMNNGVYGLTKGQRSPTAQQIDPTTERNIDGISLGLSIPGASFLARAYSGAADQLNAVMVAALEHAAAGRGFAFVEVMSPCVTYNDTYAEWSGKVHDVTTADGYDPSDRIAAFSSVYTLAEQGKIPTGLIYQSDAPAYESAWKKPGLAGPARLDVSPAGNRTHYADIMEKYAF
ncbi:MAG: hypothetical protein KDA67_04535 [Rhodobacteraceae bacterium]|nr:hypothetical protein [Paracoccaceae bacterium]